MISLIHFDALAPKTWYLLSCRCQWWFSIDKLAIHSSLEKTFFLRFNKALCFFVRLPFSVWYFLFQTNISFFGREGGGESACHSLKILPTPCNFCTSGSLLRAKPLLESWNNFFFLVYSHSPIVELPYSMSQNTILSLNLKKLF